jgi:hypothetical protein
MSNISDRLDLRLIRASLFGVALSLAATGVAQAGQIDGVIAEYSSGNQGTDLFVKTSDGKRHDLWFDNMKKPSFEGKQLPYCPDFPCTGWPSQLVLNRTHVRVFTVTQRVDGKVVQTPTKIVLLR